MTAGADSGGDLLTLLPGTAGAAPGAEWEALAELAAQLDRIALLAMCRTLRRGGLFAATATGHLPAEIVTGLRVAPRHHGVIRRRLAALEREGMLARDPGTGRYTGLHGAGLAALGQARGRLAGALPQGRLQRAAYPVVPDHAGVPARAAAR
jgi:pyochelin synthetase